MIDVQTIVGSALVNGGIVSIVSYFFQRSWARRDQKIDRLENEVQDLRREDLKNMNDRLAAAVKSRKEIHVALADIPRNYVSQAACQRTHDQLATSFEDMTASALKLERVGEQIRLTGEQLKDTNERQVELGNSLARLEGRLNGN